MGYYHASWQHRIDLTVDNTSTPSATPDVTFVIPPDLDKFWLNVQSDGDDVRITEADGETLCDYELTAWDYANRTGTISIDAATAAATAGVYKVCLYFGYASATDASTSTTIASAKSAYVAQGRPVHPMFELRPIKPGATAPDDFFLKGSSERTDIWWNVTRVMRRRAWKQADRSMYEEPFSVVPDVLQGGVSAGSLFEASASRFLFLEGEHWVSMRVIAGTSGQQYVARPKLTTVIPYADGATMAAGRVLEANVKLFVEDAEE